MKKLLFFAALIVAIGSIGGNISSAHAQTLTSSQTAVLEQQLEVAKATLANLEIQAGVVPPADAGTPTTAMTVTASAPTTVIVAQATSGNNLSASQASAFKVTLAALAGTLSQLSGSVAVNANLSSAQEQAVEATLGGMQTTLTAMVSQINNPGTANAPVAMNNQAPIANAANTPSVQTTPTTVSVATGAQTPVTPAMATAAPAPSSASAPATPSTNNTVVPQTAQASSLWSFTKGHWPTIVIILLVIAILAILFWPEKESVKTVSVGAAKSGKPQSAPNPSASTVTASTASHMDSTPAKPAMQNPVSAPATPVANAVAAPSQK